VKIFLVFLFFLRIQTTIYGQNNKINYTTQFWTVATAIGHINEKFQWQCDLQDYRQSPYENTALLKYNQLMSIQGAIHYFLKPNIILSVYEGLWYCYFIGGDVNQREFPEYRTSFQVQYNRVSGRDFLINRIRTEVREIKDNKGDFETALRGRYMLRYQHLLSHENYDKFSCYSILSDELYFNGGSPVTGYKLFDQNRLFIGIGYKCTPNISIETVYLNLFVYHSHNTDFDSDNIWQISLIWEN